VTDLAHPNPNVATPTADFRSDEFALGLGIVSGLFFGAGSGLFLALLAMLREAWQARLDVARLMMATPTAKGPSAADRVH
jgi:hypothetical protein